MITPIRAMRIDDILQRKDDLLLSADDIKEVARNERYNAIEEFEMALRDELSEKEINEGTVFKVMRIADRLKSEV